MGNQRKNNLTNTILRYDPPGRYTPGKFDPPGRYTPGKYDDSIQYADVIKNKKSDNASNKINKILTPAEYQKKAEESLTVKLFNEVYEIIKKGGK